MMLASFTNASAQDSATEPQLPGNPLTRMMSGLNPMNWQMPKLKMPTMSTFLPTSDEKERVITKKDSLVDEVSTTAKKSWQRTKETLNPMRLIPAGFRQDSQTSPAPEPKQQGGFFSNLFSPFPKSEDEEVNRSVNEFLKQEPVR
ncbi:hypothetical protein Enr13x_44520 [Stieleria neptunia]|uniref:Uncharacterized protein n=2 Tax=Stieleria neptunia TaxID=2527979 RepID=A0A518HUV5_9BACT|nr:hypothetical protein Enr13x_44520 [Stieleria neptunia]